MARLIFRMFQRQHAAWWTFAAGLAATTVLAWELHREALDLDRQRLVQRATEIQNQLDAQLEKSEMLLQHLQDYLMLSGESRNPVFARWCYQNGLTINCPWIFGIAVATNCPSTAEPQPRERGCVRRTSRSGFRDLLRVRCAATGAHLSYSRAPENLRALRKLSRMAV